MIMLCHVIIFLLREPPEPLVVISTRLSLNDTYLVLSNIITGSSVTAVISLLTMYATTKPDIHFNYIF